MTRRFRAKMLTGMTILAAGMANAGGSAPTSMLSAVSLWQRHLFPEAYNAFLPYAREQQFGRTPTPIFYLLTAGCRTGEARVVAWAKRTLRIYAEDPRIEAVDAWHIAFSREAEACGKAVLPGAPPPRIMSASGAELDAPVPVYRLSVAFKRHCYPPGEKQAASAPVLPSGKTLPADLLATEKGGDLIGLQSRLTTRFEHSAGVGKDVILLGAQPDQDLGPAPDLANRFVAQLQRDFGLSPPRGYMFMIVYNDDDDSNLLEGIPSFPDNQFNLGYSDTRPNVLTSYVLANRAQHGTLFHELTHQLVVANIGDMASEWLNEGLASLYEETVLVDHRFVGRPNFRGGFLRGVADRPTLAAIVTANSFLDGKLMGEITGDAGVTRSYINQAGAMNAAQRYLMLYLEEKGLIARTVRYYRDLAPGPDSDWPLASRETRLTAFSRATGIDPVAGNGDFARWLAATIAAQPVSSFSIPTGPALASLHC
jgi:hypothetical protein